MVIKIEVASAGADGGIFSITLDNKKKILLWVESQTEFPFE